MTNRSLPSIIISFSAAVLLALIVTAISVSAFVKLRNEPFTDPEKGVLRQKANAFVGAIEDEMRNFALSAEFASAHFLDSTQSEPLKLSYKNEQVGTQRKARHNFNVNQNEWILEVTVPIVEPPPDVYDPTVFIAEILPLFPAIEYLSIVKGTSTLTLFPAKLFETPVLKVDERQQPFAEMGSRIWISDNGKSGSFVVSTPLMRKSGEKVVSFGQMRIVESAERHIGKCSSVLVQSDLVVFAENGTLLFSKGQNAPQVFEEIHGKLASFTVPTSAVLSDYYTYIDRLPASASLFCVIHKLPDFTQKIVSFTGIVFGVSLLLFLSFAFFYCTWLSKHSITDAKRNSDRLDEIDDLINGSVKVMKNGDAVSETELAAMTTIAKARRLFAFYDKRVSELQSFYSDFTQLVEASDSAVIEINENAIIERLTTSFSRMLNCTPSKLIGIDFRNLLMGTNERQKFDVEWNYLIQGGKIAYETRLSAEGNIPVIVSFTGVAKTSPDGLFKGAIALLTDQGKYYLYKRNDYMHARLNEISELAAEVAHNFNNALSAILGSLALIEIRLRKHDAALLTGPIGENINTLREASSKATLLVRQLMKLSPGTREFGGEVELISVLKEVVSILPNPETIELLADETDLLTVPINRNSMQNSLTDLISSVYERREPGRKLIVQVGIIRSREAPIQKAQGVVADRRTVYIEVFCETSDISEPWEAENTNGSGGLKWLEAQRIIIDAGGGVVSDSATLPIPNVIVYIPVISHSDTVVHIEEHEPLNVLVIDDESTVATTISGYLKEIGENVHVASTWDEASKVLTKTEVQMIVLDKTFRKMPLESMLMQIHKIRTGIRVVVTSGTPLSMLELRKVSEWGVVTFMQKPIALDDIKAAIYKVLKSLSK